MNNIFYCYSTRLHCWLKALKFEYIDVGVSKVTNKNYWEYEKTEKLDEALKLYKKYQHHFN